MSIYDTLNPPQREAVAQTEGPVLILAGAGSGKTRVLTHRIAYLMDEKGVNPWNILAITFTNKAAQEMRERVDKLVGFGSESIWVSTFHSACVRILRRHIDNLGYDTNFTIYDTDDQKSLMKDVCRKMNIDTKIYKERSLLAQISHAKDELLTPDDMEMKAAGDYNMKKVASVYREYQAALRKNNALDFDDLIVKTVELFEKCGAVLEYYNLCVVGDDDQSIYKFRGANIGNILGFEHVFPDARVIRLEQNYRSTKNILNAANQVIANNTERKAKTLWTENEEGSKVHFRQFLNAYEEAEYVAGEIGKLKRNGLGNYRDCAILYRTNAQSRIFEEKFIAANIPYKLVGGVNFYARKEIKDLLCYLKTINNARDDLAVQRIINVPKRGIGATTLGRVQDYADNMGISLYEALRVAEEVPSIGRSLSKIDGFVTFIQMLKSKADVMTVEEILQEVIDSTGYVAELEAEDTEESRARIENIDELISKTVAYQEAMEEQNQPATLSGFLEEVALVADIDTVDPDQDYVLLMTLHSAKGLEFPKVFMVGMEDGIFPSHMTISYGDDGEMEEERRLCYVGITRAMKDLTLTCAQQRMIRGETQYNRVSRFVREIPRELVDLGHTIQEKKPKVEELIPTPAKYSKMKEILQGRNYKPREFKVTKANSLDYEVGDTVRHIKFGVGIVKEIVEGGRDYEVTVEFDKVGVKKMFASFAKLKKI
ncbi:MAG: UvrD-helicase domain-containing protein [Ruminococcus sp.]|nr:UvrD-helicase domain-containing protein [Ruminococcus sp.]